MATSYVFPHSVAGLSLVSPEAVHSRRMTRNHLDFGKEVDWSVAEARGIQQEARGMIAKRTVFLVTCAAAAEETVK